MSRSQADEFKLLPMEERMKRLAALTEEEKTALNFYWPFWARPEQLPPEWDWQVWLILAGRGFGKTRTGAEWVRECVKTCRYVNLVGATSDDARDIMVQGESGIMYSCPKWERPEYKRSERKLVWPNGAESLIFTADEPDRLRGKQHEKLWMDEVAAWRYHDAYDQAMFGLRLGDNPQALITTTPRPIKILKELIASAGKTTAVTRGTTYDNKGNLAKTFVTKILEKYEGTRLGRQELNAEVLDDVPGAKWTRAMIDDHRVKAEDVPDLQRVVVAIDPAVTSGDEANEAGVVVVGAAMVDGKAHAYVLEDKSMAGMANEWAKAAIDVYNDRRGDRIVGESNNGGDLIELVIRTIDPTVKYRKVFASRGKITRAEPVASFYEQGRVHHVGIFAKMEDEMCTYAGTSGEESPNRMDALVWALTDLMIDEPLEGGGEAASSWKVWPQAERPPACREIFVSVFMDRDEDKNVIRLSAQAWGISTEVPGHEEAGFIFEHVHKDLPLHKVVDELAVLRNRYMVNHFIVPTNGKLDLIYRQLANAGIRVRKIPYDPTVGPQLAAELVRKEQVVRPERAWALRLARDFQRYPFGDTMVQAQSTGVALAFLRNHREFVDRHQIDDEDEDAVETRAAKAIYG